MVLKGLLVSLSFSLVVSVFIVLRLWKKIPIWITVVNSTYKNEFLNLALLTEGGTKSVA